MKRIFAFVFILIMVFGMIPFGVSAAEVTLEDEIKNTMIGGKLFNESDYPAETGAAAEIFAFSEIGYTYNGNFTNFGMYVYVYNPSQKVIKQNGSHQVLMAVKFDEAGNALEWEEFDMVFVSRTDNNRFLKFKIIDHVSSIDGKKIVNRVNRDARRYSVAELEIHYDGNTKATNVTVGQSYVFTGFMADDSLGVRSYKFEVLKPNVNHTTFRSVSSSKGDGHQNQLSSVYFSVPNSVTNQYGYLSMIKASWNEQKTQPIVVCDNVNVVNRLAGDHMLVGQSSWIGMDIGEYNAQTPYGFADGQLSQNGLMMSYHVLYNYKSAMASYVSKRITTLAYMFYDDSIEENEASVSAEQLIAHIEKYDYADFLFADSVDTGRVKGTQTAKIAIGDTFNFENFSGVRDWFTNVWNSISGGEVLKKEFENVAPIYKVTAADMLITDKDELAQRLLVDVNDIDAIRVAYNEALLRNESLWLFRFAVTDYYAHDITSWQDSNQNSLANTHGYYAEQTVFLDFNIIELTCEKEGVATVIPVSSAKQDIAGDVTPPTDGVDANTDVNWDSLLAKLFSVIFVLIILAGFAYFLPIMQGVMNWLFPKKRE